MQFIKTILSALLLAVCTISTANATKSGYFNVYNETSKTISIGVGDFFPTKYTIKPHGSVGVAVSTDNQAIRIYSVS